MYGQTLVVSTLRESVSYFMSKMVDRSIYLQFAGKVKSVYQKMDAKYFLKEFEASDKDNEYGVPIRKQAETLWISDRPFAVVLREDIKNGLGIEDHNYYYVIFRKRLSLSKWARTFNLTKYQRTPGIYLPLQILRHIERERVQGQTKIVLVVGDGRIFIADFQKIRDFYTKIRDAVLINEWGVVVTVCAVDKEIFEEMI